MAVTEDLRRRMISALHSRAAGNEASDLLAAVSALSGAEAAYLDAVVAGTAAASKAVVLDSGGDVTWVDGGDIALGTSTGTKIGTGTTQKLGFFNATPVAQRSAYTQTYVTADKTHANPTATAHTYPGSGNLFDATPDDLLINIRTDSTANAVADTVINIKSLADNLNQAIADIADVKQLVNSVIDDLQALGLVG